MCTLLLIFVREVIKRMKRMFITFLFLCVCFVALPISASAVDYDYVYLKGNEYSRKYDGVGFNTVEPTSSNVQSIDGITEVWLVIDTVIEGESRYYVTQYSLKGSKHVTPEEYFNALKEGRPNQNAFCDPPTDMEILEIVQVLAGVLQEVNNTSSPYEFLKGKSAKLYWSGDASDKQLKPSSYTITPEELSSFLNDLGDVSNIKGWYLATLAMCGYLTIGDIDDKYSDVFYTQEEIIQRDAEKALQETLDLSGATPYDAWKACAAYTVASSLLGTDNVICPDDESEEGYTFCNEDLSDLYERILDNDDIGTELQRAYIVSLYSVDGWPAGLDIALQREGSSSAIDAATCTYALRQYIAYHQEGRITASYQSKMAVWLYKLQATMGLAAGLVTEGQSVTQEEIENFLDIAYGATYNVKVDYPNSRRLGDSVNATYYYYLVHCYQEFGFYATTIIEALSADIRDGVKTFTSHAADIRALRELYQAVSWADDENLWAFWNHKDEEQSYSLKDIYDHLLSVNAFSAAETYDPAGTEGAFRYFFTSEGSFELSPQIQEGIVASATFLPMRTNIYDPYAFSDIVDMGWLLNFHSKFGYNRKALYIDTSVDAAMTYQRTGTHGDLRVCTLQDLLTPEADIVLYLDDNLYNVNTLADLTDKAYEHVTNTDEGGSQTLFATLREAIVNIYDVSMENIAKTGGTTTYSKKVQRNIDSSKWSTFFLEGGDLEEYLTPDNIWDEYSDTLVTTDAVSTPYSILLPFSVLSGVYHDENVFSTLNEALSDDYPVFISSPSMPYIELASGQERNTIYNYLLLKNLDSQITLDYATNLDMTSPVYMDIYGNILTESGIVVIPAAANATLFDGSYVPYNAALYSTYGDDFVLVYDSSTTSINSTLSKVLTPADGYWQLTSVQVNGGVVNLAKLSTADKESLTLVSDVFRYDLSTGLTYSKYTWMPLITEVLRGAPIEHINKDFEGLNTATNITISGLRMAHKLEILVEALSPNGTNTTLSIPNPAYMDGVEYIVFFAYRILLLFIVVIWMFNIYVDAVGGGIGLRTAFKCIGSVVLVVALIVGVPAAFELSYYQSNKLLLQDETEYLMMLNLEKRESGREVGITKISAPDTSTTLYLKLADIQIPWYDLFYDIAFSATADSLENVYSTYENQHPLVLSDEVEVLNDAIYITTDKLFSSTDISFSPTSKTLYQDTRGDTPASYYTPYYYFLEQLVHKNNEWALNNNCFAYSTVQQRGGRVKTLGHVQSYLTSEYCMQDGMDYFGLYTLYDVTPPMQYTDEKLFDDTVMESVRASQWCNMGLSHEETIVRIEKLNDYVREWIAEHRELIGKVTDETFLKSMALSCAMEHNRLFNTQHADYLEIYELSNEDLMRLSITDSNTVMRGSTLSYARFVYSTGGIPAVIAAAILALVTFIGGWLKPLATLLVFFLTCVSIFVFKLILRKDNSAVYGYVCTILLMCAVNVIGSAALKLTMYLPTLSLSPTVCILLQIILQCMHCYLLMWVVRVAAKDWRNLGFTHFNFHFNRVTKRRYHSREVRTPRKADGWSYFDDLTERFKRRNRRL